MTNDSKGLLGILLIITSIIAGVQWFFVRFTHWSVALALTVLIAFFISSLYVSLKHARPNGGSRGPANSEYIIPMFVVFLFLLCALALVCHLTQTKIPKIAFFIPLSLIIVFAISRYVYKYIHISTYYLANFSTCNIQLVDETGGTSAAELISFKNSSTGFTTDIQPEFKEQPYHSVVRFADKIIFRNFSNKVGKLFIKEFPFDYNLLKEKKSSRIGLIFWLSEKIVLPIKIVIKPDNVVDLYIDNHLVKQYQLNIGNSQKKQSIS